MAGVLDLFSRKIVGWDMASQMDASLVENALRMALYQRQQAKDCSIIQIGAASMLATKSAIYWPPTRFRSV